jgi:hypothetical protein
MNDRIVQAYPVLTTADVSAAAEYAAKMGAENRSSPVSDQRLYLLPDQNIPEKSSCAVSNENPCP